MITFEPLRLPLHIRSAMIHAEYATREFRDSDDVIIQVWRIRKT